MSTIIKINSKTRVIAKSNKNLTNYKTKLYLNSLLGLPEKINEKSLVKSVRDNNKVYKNFLESIFKNKLFVSEKLLNKSLKEKFGVSTWYRKRMLDLGIISINNGIVKLVNKKPNE